MTKQIAISAHEPEFGCETTWVRLHLMRCTNPKVAKKKNRVSAMMAVVSDNTTAVSDRVGTMTEGTTVVQDCTHSDTMLKVLD